MAISTIGTDALAASAVTTTKLASGVPSRSQLPAGTVLQVVQQTYIVQAATTSSSFVSTGINASITPTSNTSKILALSFGTGYYGAGNGIALALYRGGNFVFSPAAIDGTNKYFMSYNGSVSPHLPLSFSYLDSPASTSSLTYSIYLASYNSGQNVNYSSGGSQQNGTVSLTLMEIAA